MLMKDLPIEERPRERFMTHGPGSLSTAELLAIVLRTGTRSQSALSLATTILQIAEGLENINDLTLNELTEIPGIGPSKAIQLLASIELGKRTSQALTMKEYKLAVINTPFDCFQLLKNEMKYLKQEHFIVLSLDTKNRLIARDTLFIGHLNSTLIHPREIFATAIKRRADKIVCVHNHPSGDVNPSEEDIMMTSMIGEAGMMMGIKVRDHVIVGRDDYTSMKAYGYL